MKQTANITSSDAGTTWTASPNYSLGIVQCDLAARCAPSAGGSRLCLVAAIALTLCTGNVGAQSRSIVQYYTNTLAATPTNFFGSNVLAGTNVHLERGPQGQLTVNATGGSGGAVVDTNVYQLGHIILTNISGTGALTNAGAFQPSSLVLTNISGTGALTNANAFQPAHVILTNLTGTGALTNQSELNAKQFGSLVLSNLSGTGAFTNLLAADGGLVLHTVGGTVTVSNSVAGGGSGETNYNANASFTTGSRVGLVHQKDGPTNYIKTLSTSPYGSITDTGTNLHLIPGMSITQLGGGSRISPMDSGTLILLNTLAAAGGLNLHSNANLLTFSNSVIAQPANLTLTNLSGTGALTNQGELDGKQFGSQILTNLSGTGALTNGTAFQPAHEVLTNISGTGALTNQGELNAKQFGSLTLTNLSGTGAFTNLLAVAAPLVLSTNGGVITISNATAESFFSDSWTPISDDTNTVGWWRSYAGVTYDASSNVTQVADASGFGHPLKQNTAGDYPFYLTNGLTGGRASLAFDGSADWLFTDPFAFEQPASIYFLYKGVTWISGRRLYSALAAAGGTATNAYIYQTSSEPYFFHRTGNKVGNALNILPTGNWGTIKAVWDVANSKLSVNGRGAIGGDPGGGGFGGMVIAGTEAGALNAHIQWGEMIARTGTDTDDQTLKTMRYLQRASGQKFYLVVLDGNSLTAGVGLSPASLVPSKVVTNYWPTSQEWFTKNAAVGGDTTSNMIVRAAATDQYYHPNNSTNILTAWEISNELFNGISTNAAYSNFVYYCQARRAAGWKVVALTVLPRSGGSPPASFEADRLNVNLMIRANYLAFADALADVGTNGFLGCTLCSATNTYFSDGTHLTDAGNLIVSQYITNAISRIGAGPVALTTTNTLYQTNGVNLGSGGTLNFVTGSNTLVQATNAAGVNHLQVNVIPSAGGASFPTQLPTYAGASLVTDGADVYWGGPFFRSHMWEDFHTGTNVSGRLGEYHWSWSGQGNGTMDNSHSGFGRPHVITLRTDGTSSDISHLSDFNRSHWFGRGPTVFGGSIYLSHVPSSDFNQAFEVRNGFLGGWLGPATNGLYLYASTNSPAWQLYSATNSIAVTSTSISNVVAGWTAYQVHVNADATVAVLYIGTCVTNLYPVATNNIGSIPRQSHQACTPGASIIKRVGTDRKTNSWDYWFFDEKLTTPR